MGFKDREGLAIDGAERVAALAAVKKTLRQGV
jgi:hypothetical protein